MEAECSSNITQQTGEPGMLTQFILTLKTYPQGSRWCPLGQAWRPEKLGCCCCQLQAPEVWESGTLMSEGRRWLSQLQGGEKNSPPSSTSFFCLGPLWISGAYWESGESAFFTLSTDPHANPSRNTLSVTPSSSDLTALWTALPCQERAQSHYPRGGISTRKTRTEHHSDQGFRAVLLDPCVKTTWGAVC